nr:hypothetical protein [Streptomyces spiramenti]
MQRVGQAVMLHRAGDREEARNRLAELWADPGPDAGPLQRCTIAHYLAAAQDDPRSALRWDLVALAEADAVDAGPAPCTDGGEPSPVPRTQAGGAPSRGASDGTRGLYPLLYLRLAGDHLALDCVPAARHELGRARSAAARLGDDDHGRRTRAAIEALADRLADVAAGTPPSGPRPADGGGGDPPPDGATGGSPLA